MQWNGVQTFLKENLAWSSIMSNLAKRSGQKHELEISDHIGVLKLLWITKALCICFLQNMHFLILASSYRISLTWNPLLLEVFYYRVKCEYSLSLWWGLIAELETVLMTESGKHFGHSLIDHLLNLQSWTKCTIHPPRQRPILFEVHFIQRETLRNKILLV